MITLLPTLKRHYLKIATTLLVFVITTINSLAQPPAPPAHKYRLLPWPVGKKAAMSITFDDNLPGQFTGALPALNARSLKASYFVITNTVNWADAKAVKQDGHEVGSHTCSHRNLKTLDTATIHYELERSRLRIDSALAPAPGMPYLPTSRCLTLAWPQGGGGGSTIKEDTIRRLAAPNYIAARNASVNADGYEVYNINRRLRVGSYLMGANISAPKFDTLMRNTIAAKGWFVPLYHAIDQVGGYQNIPLPLFTQHLDSVVARQSDLYIAPFQEITRYVQSRNCTVYDLTSSAPGSLTYFVGDSLPQDSIFNLPLASELVYDSIIATSITGVTQNQLPLSYTLTDSSVIFSAVPDGGDVVVTYNITTGTAPDCKCTFTASPNPLKPSQPLTITYLASRIEDNNLSLTLTNMLGQQVLSLPNLQLSGGYAQVPLSLPAGIYILKAVSNQSTFTKRLVVE